MVTTLRMDTHLGEFSSKLGLEDQKSVKVTMNKLIYNYIHDVYTTSPNTFLPLLTLRQF